MKRIQLAGLVLAGSLCAPVTMASDAEALSKYRHDVYEAIGGHMGSMAGILRKGVYPEDLVVHARGIAALSKITPKVFPEGSLHEKSDALPDIWENRADFDKKMKDFTEAAEAMAAAAESGDMARIGGAIQALGGTCKACHDNYKKD